MRASRPLMEIDGGVYGIRLKVRDLLGFHSDSAVFEPLFVADCPANCDESTTPPILNVNDFSCSLNRFAAGCP
ncbi:MAG: hypothetical protein ACKVW3_11160 [Phycisphaerales bacterium]